MNQAYALVVQDSNSLNKYKGFSDQVYGEAGHDLISELIRKACTASRRTYHNLPCGVHCKYGIACAGADHDRA